MITDTSAGAGSAGLSCFLFGLFSAYWAQETNRGPWLWFFMGWLFAPITGVVLVVKNAEDKRLRSEIR